MLVLVDAFLDGCGLSPSLSCGCRARPKQSLGLSPLEVIYGRPYAYHSSISTSLPSFRDHVLQEYVRFLINDVSSISEAV